eukprot:10869335-Ditylum_brightwellii.AAC.1
MDCDGMPKLEPAKDHDKSCTKLSIEDRWKGCTIQYINNVKKATCGGHWLISCTMYDGRQSSRRYCRQEEYYQE